MTLLNAIAAIGQGKKFGEVIADVPAEYHEALRHWFVHVHGRTIPARRAGESRGEFCLDCGGIDFIQAGSCLTCATCGRPGSCS